MTLLDLLIQLGIKVNNPDNPALQAVLMVNNEAVEDIKFEIIKRKNSNTMYKVLKFENLSD